MPSDTAYIVVYQQYREVKRALVIAPNPIQAERQAERGLPQEGLKDVRVMFELRDVVHTAQDDQHGVATL